MNNQELLPGVNPIVVFSDKLKRDLFIQILQRAAGIEPVGSRNTSDVRRALYGDARSRTIVNVSSPKVLERLGNPERAYAFSVKNPLQSAEIAETMLREFKYFDVEVIDADDVELGLIPEFMYFVKASQFPLLLFWPLEPTKEQLEQLPPSIPWVWVTEFSD